MNDIAHDPLIRSALLGVALGDALGLPYEGLTPAKIAKRTRRRPVRPALLPGMMMVSDDTDHACMALAALGESAGDGTRFSRDLARRFRWWFAALPPGIGMATAKSALRLWCGVSPEKSGVMSAGNGPLMRAGILGVALRDDPESLREIVDRATRLTHRDQRALDAAYVFAEACAQVAKNGRPTDPRRFCAELAGIARTPEIREKLNSLSGYAGSRPPAFSGKGVSGYIPESLHGALAAFLFGGPDGAAIIRTAIAFGGDTDSVASFAGCLAGAADPAAFDSDEARKLFSGLKDFPWNRTTLETFAAGTPPPKALIALRPIRNLFQLAVVISHGLLRPIL